MAAFIAGASYVRWKRLEEQLDRYSLEAAKIAAERLRAAPVVPDARTDDTAASASLAPRFDPEPYARALARLEAESAALQPAYLSQRNKFFFAAAFSILAGIWFWYERKRHKEDAA